MSVTSDFRFFLLVCPDACSFSQGPRSVVSCPPMCVGVKVLGFHNYPCFSMGPCPIALTPFVPFCLVYILFLWLHDVALFVLLGTKGLLL